MQKLIVSVLLSGLTTMSASQSWAATTIIGSYYEDHLSNGCANGACSLNFPLTPAKLYLTINQVSCLVTTGGAIAYAGVAVSNTVGGEGNGRVYYLANPSIFNSGGTVIASYNNQISFKIPPKSSPVVAFQLSGKGAGSADCTITGNLFNQ